MLLSEEVNLTSYAVYDQSVNDFVDVQLDFFVSILLQFAITPFIMIMKNQLGFIPENISAISYVSLHMQPTIQQDMNEHLDSTDNLVEEILRQRAERLAKEEEKIELGSLDETNKKLLLQIKDSNENYGAAISDFKLKDSLKNSQQKPSRHQMIPEINESMAQKQQIFDVVAPHEQTKLSAQFGKEHSQVSYDLPHHVEDKIQTLNNQTYQQIMNDNQQHTISEHDMNQPDKNIRNIQDDDNKFTLPQIDNIHNQSVQSIEKSQHEFHQKSLKLNPSISPSEKRQSSHNSIHFQNYIQEPINEQNSDPKGSSQAPSNKSKQSKVSSHESRRKQIVHEIQNLDSQLQVKNSMMETPINLFQKHGFYDFTPQVDQKDVAQDLVLAITQQLNQMNQNDKDQVQHLMKRQQSDREKHQKERIQQQLRGREQQLKLMNPVDQFETDYSDYTRDIKILQHRYESNIKNLTDQTKKLLEYYHSMILDQQNKQMKRKTMELQIQNKREKISLRNASYTKRFNFISPIPKNNDKPIQFKAKFKISEHLVKQYEALQYQIEQEKQIQLEQEHRLHLLTSYYEFAKQKKLSNGQQIATQYEYNSKIQKYSRVREDTSKKGSSQSLQCSIANFNTQNNNYEFDKSKRKLQAQGNNPISYYNLLKYKKQISKEMILQFEVYNMGKLKRLKDQTRLLKKQLMFVDQHMQHFDRTFADQLKNYQQLSKPKITYQSFQVIDPKTPYTKSPYSRDYHANSKGCNNINIYRPDFEYTSPARKLNKSISQSQKYIIKRQKEPGNFTTRSRSKKDDLLMTQNISRNTSLKSSQQTFFKRKAFLSPQQNVNRSTSRSQNQYGLKAGIPLQKIKQAPLIIKKPIQIETGKPKTEMSLSKSKKSLSIKPINLVNKKEEVQTEQHIALPRPQRPRGKINTKISPRKQVTSQYYISAEQHPTAA